MTKKQTSLVVAEPRDRIDKNLIIDFSDFDKPIPDVSIFDEPTRCHRINKEWAKLVFGFLEILADVKAWKHATDERYVAVQAIQNFMVGEDCIPPEPPSSGCIKYPTYHSSIRYLPVNPYTDPDTIPDGYLDKPFYIYLGGDPFPVNDLYDITVRLTAIPSDLGFFDLINGNFPQIIITVQGIGEAEIILQNRPFGGACAITIDRPLNAFDMFIDGIIDTGAIFIGLNQDITSFPGESVTSKEISLEFEEDGIHEIHLTFIPEYDDSLPIFYFGGVFKGYNLCGLTPVAQGENIVNDIRISGCNIEALIDGNWIVKGSILACIQGVTDPMQAQINSNSNRLDVAETDIQTLYLDVANNADDIQQLVLGQQAQQLKIDDHENRITVNETDIQTIYLENDNQDTTLNDHETRITALENASGGGGGSNFSIKTTAYTIYLDSAQNFSGGFTELFTKQHLFEYPNAMVVTELKMGNTTSGAIAKIRCRLNDGINDIAVGTNQAWVYSNSVDTFASTQLNQVFEGITPANLNIAIDGETSSGVGRLQAFQQVQIFIIEYGDIAAQPSNVVTFDVGGMAYTLPSGQVGTVQAGGLTGDCLRGNVEFNQWIEVQVDLGAVYQINSVFIAFRTGDNSNCTARLFIEGQSNPTPTPLSGSNDTWIENLSIGYQELPLTGQIIRVRLTKETYGLVDARLDNILIDYQ